MVSANLQRLLPQHLVSKLISKLSHCRITWFKNWAIQRFIRKYQVDTAEALVEDWQHYPNLNQFFTRHLKPHVRPIAMQPHTLISPADGFVQQLGNCDTAGNLLAVKGKTYSLEQLLAEDKTLCDQFAGASYLTVYLSPRDYHRVHMPYAGQLLKIWSIPGKLFAVKPHTIEAIPDIFTRNERVLCLFDTALGPMLVILVGAMLVSGIHIVDVGNLTPNHTRQIEMRDYTQETLSLHFQKGEELGYFEFGSTVIVLLAPKANLQWLSTLQLGSAVKFGQAIGVST